MNARVWTSGMGGVVVKGANFQELVRFKPTGKVRWVRSRNATDTTPAQLVVLVLVVGG
jgi:hypothetical protein